MRTATNRCARCTSRSGNLRRASFGEIWTSPEADALRARIAARECWCTHEIYLWPSIVFQPISLARALVGARVWRRARPVNGDSADAGH